MNAFLVSALVALSLIQIAIAGCPQMPTGVVATNIGASVGGSCPETATCYTKNKVEACYVVTSTPACPKFPSGSKAQSIGPALAETCFIGQCYYKNGYSDCYM
ncbi:unnamed protein product, partial [Mesorhabditis belari]|uniref:Secreted protein n=1 Tax=Mesorhabditis belari TaxID=2138241 RepID=A0AAF3ELC7_9BILA